MVIILQMWWLSGIGAVVWILVSVAVALAIGRMVKRADVREQIHAEVPSVIALSSNFNRENDSLSAELRESAAPVDIPQSLRA